VRTAIGLTALALFAAAETHAQEPSFVIRADNKIGSFAVKRDGTLAGLERAFGKAVSVTRRPEGCLAAWGRFGLAVELYNLGGQDPCTPRYGFFYRAIMGGPRWRTASGLRVGHSERLVRRYHPRARFHGAKRGVWPAGWWLVTRVSRFGPKQLYPGLMATIRRGRVSAYYVRYQAGGD
jgi:hypothetical protein